MMSLLDYAIDVNLDIEKIKKICDELGISYTDDETLLSETNIIELDNYISNMNNEDEEEISEELSEYLEDAKDYDKAVEMANNKGYNLDNTESFEKVKSKQKRTQDSKKTSQFQTEKKNMYKHKEKLQSNAQEVQDNVILYKEGMTVAEIAEALGVSGTELIKKLIGLGIMVNLNQNIDFETTEVLVSDYDKVLKREETADISNFENF